MLHFSIHFRFQAITSQKFLTLFKNIGGVRPECNICNIFLNEGFPYI